jgi:alcohol dehydrogenase
VFLDSLKNEGITVFELGGVKPNPRYSLVKEGIELCKKENIQAILAVGGGSVIDSAKAIAFGALIEEDVWDYYLYGKAIKQILPLGVVLTIPAAGSESSTSTVITHDETLLKRGLGSPLFIPKFAIINPELHYSLPKFQTACGIVDMSAHLIERYFTQVEHNDLTDRLIEANLKSIIANALTCY